MEVLRVYNGFNIKAKNASDDLDIDSILRGCNMLEEEINSLNYCIRDLGLSSNLLGEKAFSLNNESPYSETIDEFINDIVKFQNNSYNIINDIRVNAVNKYNQIQNYYNEQAANQDNQ